MKVMISSLLGIGNQGSLTETSFVFLESKTLSMNLLAPWSDQLERDERQQREVEVKDDSLAYRCRGVLSGDRCCTYQEPLDER